MTSSLAQQVWRRVQTKPVFLLVSLSWLLLIGLIFSISGVFDRVPNESHPTSPDIQFQRLNARLNEANRQIEELVVQNRQLSKHLQILSGLKKAKPGLLKSVTTNTGLASLPSSATEQSLRQLKRNIDEIWLYVKKKYTSSVSPFVNEWRYNMIYDLNVLSNRDSEWRLKEITSLGELVQNRITHLQNPSDCQKAKKLVCDLNKNCGFGCQMHHLAHCMVAAMALNRTLVAETDKWRTHSANVWNKVFQPLSQTCLHSGGDNHTHWNNGDVSSYQVIHYPIIDFIDPIPKFLPLVIPQQISEPLQRLSGEPFIWFIGQVLKYIMRPSDTMDDYIERFKQKNRFTHPIVGLHVRRTDKIGTEAKFHSIDEYMSFVDDFYSKLDLRDERNLVQNRTKRRIYLATDEPDVWKSEISPYRDKGYLFTGDIKLSESADPSRRSGFESLHNVVVDLMLLSQCDYIVCTFSSQICRLAFELMQTRPSAEDLSLAFYSLDDIYYYGGQVFHGKKAILGHRPESVKELSFKAGDILGIANNLHNGYNYGDHNRTKDKGYYPRFKVVEYVESEPFAVFD